MAQTVRVHASNRGTSDSRLQHPNKVPTSNTEHANHHFKFPSTGGDFFPETRYRENGSASALVSQNQDILEELHDYIQGTEDPTDNNNKANSLPNKMATSNSSGTNQPTANANGFQMSMNSSSGLPNKSGPLGLGMPASVHLNNQLSSILDPGSTSASPAVPSRNLSESNPNPANMKLLASNQPNLSPQTRYNEFNSRQEMLLRDYREVPIAPRAPNSTEQYGSQQRFMSAQSENQHKRGLNSQSTSAYHPNYYSQESSAPQAGQRAPNSQPDERNMITNQHFQWPNRLQTTNHCSSNLPTNTSPGPPMSRAQLQQQGLPQQQSPYMIMGGSQQQQPQQQHQPQSQQAGPQQSYASYMMQQQQQGGMKAGALPQSQQYYGNMPLGRQVVSQASLSGQPQHMANQMQTPPQDYSSFQQQQMQHRFPQPQFQQQMSYMAQQQQRQLQQQHQPSYPQPPTGIPRMPSSHPQPILPKPASGDMFGSSASMRYSSSNVGDNLPGPDFPSSRMTDQQQHGIPSASQSYGNTPMGRMGSSSEMLAKYGSSQGAYQRNNPQSFPVSLHSRHTPSPNITLGSPMRVVADGTSPSVGMPNFGTDSPTSTGSLPTYPRSKMPPPFGMAGTAMSGSGVSGNSLPPASVGGSTAGSAVGGTAAAAAAAAVLEAANSGPRYPGAAQGPGPPFVSPQEMMLSSKGSENMPASGLSPMQLGSMMGANVQTGRVPSPTLNELPTAEDVEAMIESMRAEEAGLPTDNDNQQQPPSQGSAPPSVASLPTTVASSPSQPQGTPVNGPNSNTDSRELAGSTMDLTPAIEKGDSPPSAPSSPLSNFSGLSPGVSPSGVSITSSFGNAEIDLDEINPSLPNNSISMSSYQFPSSRQNQQQYEKFSKLYELSDEPERKEFLNKYQAFMNSQGTQIAQVPVVMRQPLDLFKFYTVVQERGGLQEVVKRKLWQEVLEAMNLPTDNPNVVNHLRNQYSRYLLSYEMKFSKSNSIDDIKINLLEGSGIPPPNATVTCSEAIIPTNSLTQTSRAPDSTPIHGTYSSMTNDSVPNLPPSYSGKDGYPEPSYDTNKMYPEFRENSGSFPMNPPTPSSPFGMPQYPYGGERRSSLSNHPQSGGLPPYMMSQRNMYQGPSSLSQFYQQSNSQAGHSGTNYQHAQYQQRSSPSLMGSLASPHSMVPNASSQDKVHSLWGSQYSPSAEPEHMVDYPPGAHNRLTRSSSGPQSQYSPAPPYGSYPGRQNQYSATPPYRPSPSPSPSSRQPMAQAPPLQALPKMKYPVQQTAHPPSQQQSHQQQSHTSSIKREMPFPNDCVEATRPVFTKKRKLTSRDLGPVEAWRVMMSLKSGLLSEATWALDTLNILLYDDNTVLYFMLSQLPGLLDNLIDHFRRYLIDIFDTFVESEISVGSVVLQIARKEENEEKIEKLNRAAKNSFTALLVASTFDIPNDGFQSGSGDWLMGGGDTTRHIQTHLGFKTRPEYSTKVIHCREETECSEDVILSETDENCEGEAENENTNLTESDDEKSLAECKDDNCCANEMKCDGNFSKLKTELPSPVVEEGKSKADIVVKKEKEPSQEELKTQENDKFNRESEVEQFTARLKKELDLDLDSDEEDTESDAYIRSVVSKINVKQDAVVEEQSCGKEDAPLCLRTESQDAVSRRCLCVSNILRGLSFVPGNDAEMSRHAGLLLIVGRLLLLHHKHSKRVPYRHSYLQDEIEVECPSDDRHDWWWYCLEGLRENALVITANVAGQLDLSLYPEAISLPLLDGLLHWFICPSAAAQDPMPTATPGTSLSPRQLVLEALAKMSILESNVDIILSTPPLTRVDELYTMLVRLVGERDNPVTRELALVLLSNLAQGENSFVGFGDSKACISMLLEFIEDAASSMSAYSSGSALAQAGFHSESFCGTSVDMLRRAASTLVCLARIRSNRALFLPFQQRILRLSVLRVLDSTITNHLAEILFYLSR